MKIFVTGTRGIPDIPGGRENGTGVNLVNLYTPASKNLEAIVHTFLSVLKARQYNADILHIHAIGPGLMVPLTPYSKGV